MNKYLNRKAVFSLLLSGSVALSMSGCGGTIVDKPSVSMTTVSQEQTINEYDSVEKAIEEKINGNLAPEGTRYYSAVRVIGNHQYEGKANVYDAMVTFGIYHSEIFQDNVYSIEDEGTARTDLSTYEVADGQVVNSTTCIEDLDNYNGQEPAIFLLHDHFSQDSIEYLKNNSLLESNLVREKYMNALDGADYVTTATNFKELIVNGNTVCIDKDGITVKVEAKEKSKGMN